MDVLHVYERSRRFTLLSPGKKAWLEDYSGFNEVVEQLKELALRDFSGEGFDTTDIAYELELDMKFGGQLNVKRVASPLLEVGSREDMQALYAAFEKEFSEAYSALGLHPEAGVEIEAFVLKARLRQPTPERPRVDTGDEDPSAAQTGTREALFDGDAGRIEAPVYEMALLRAGHVIAGPALVESDDMTAVVAPGWTLEVDGQGALVLTHEEGEQADV
jgi:N-methylhydantoinase A/acetophenone carboxylase